MAQQDRMGKDIRRLAELTESSLEEARAQRPEPVIQWLLPGGREATDAIEMTGEQLLRPLYVDSIRRPRAATSVSDASAGAG